jgi:pSer/pThr/pTyr-binding forkhead associated (FHA) protein
MCISDVLTSTSLERLLNRAGSADDERVTVTDLRSTNGTYLDGTEIQSMQAYEVLPGATLIFGDEHLAMYELVLELDDSPAEPAPDSA